MNDPTRDKLWTDVYARVKAENKFACNPKHEADMAVRAYDGRLAAPGAAIAAMEQDAALPAWWGRFMHELTLQAEKAVRTDLPGVLETCALDAIAASASDEEKDWGIDPPALAAAIAKDGRNLDGSEQGLE